VQIAPLQTHFVLFGLSKPVGYDKLESESEAMIMKRCPECGFRAKEDIRLCPLCGVRMMYDPDGKTVQKKTHKHTERGEVCFLSDAEQKPVIKKKPLAGLSRKEKSKSPSQIAIMVVIVVLYLLMEACQGF